MRPAGCLARAGISGGLWPPLAPALGIASRCRVLSTAPQGSCLLSCLPPAERTHEGLVFFNALPRIFPRMWIFVPISRLPWSFSDILQLLMGYPLLAIPYHHQGAARRGCLWCVCSNVEPPPSQILFLVVFCLHSSSQFSIQRAAVISPPIRVNFSIKLLHYLYSIPYAVCLALFFFF